MNTKHTLFLITLLSLGFWVLNVSLETTSQRVQAETNAPTASAPQAVEDDMHEFMEYVFQPTYLRLKAAMTAPPVDKKGWFELKTGSLILAEGGNLILLRGPQENRAEWNQLATELRTLGSKMYRASHDKNFDLAQENYKAMIHACNACHQKFADGEHQLKP